MAENKVTAEDKAAVENKVAEENEGNSEMLRGAVCAP
jgi:hypothetical protein